MSIARQFQMVYELMGDGMLSAPELARRLEVSVRTVYRDVEALSGAGIPVYAQSGRGGGIGLMAGYTLDKSLLSESERHRLWLALKSVSAARPEEMAALIKKLGAPMGETDVDWLSVDFSRWGSEARDVEKFDAVVRALSQKLTLTFDYAASSGDVERRTVSPSRLMYKSQAWYLEAFCAARQDYRLFKLHRMRGVELGAARAPLPSRPQAAAEPGVRPGSVEKVVLLFAPRLAYRVYDEFDEGCVETLEDGTLRVTAYMPAGTWLMSHVLSFGAGVELLEPGWMRLLLREAAKNVWAVYQRSND